MRYKVNKATGIVIRAALPEEASDESFDIIESSEALERPELHVFKDGSFHPDFDLYTEAARAKREEHLTNLQLAFEDRLAEPVIVTNLRFNADNATLDLVTLEIGAIESTGNFSAEWTGVPDINGIKQFHDEGRSLPSVLVELIDLQQSILNTRTSLERRLSIKCAEVKSLDVLQALEEFDSSSI